MKKLAILAAVALAGCVETVPQSPYPQAPYPYPQAPYPQAPYPAGPVADSGPVVPPRIAARNFASVVSRMEPVIERECWNLGVGNCDFRIVVDDRPGQPPNAFQTLDRSGRPIIAFTLPLIAEARNTDELAFVMGHEAAHHIAGHIPRQQQEAMTGALIAGVLTAATGADSSAIRGAQNIGGTFGARRFAKDHELEADSLGTVLAWQAGYDPERGAEFFTRIPDPGNRFLGTHPPNASRIDTVRRTLAGLR
ncbi:M48 family metallopeptidase [Defluviimonas sp. D31]|uniref:M48 family metallopeptidase n=1 Tax=Defluviimonas sp. D31 TaxID=3083253 RepID=UPI00296F53A7|nr:M48 family metallopeptidase [Defluviimonas sp. D31]MDW4548338.1 M48 family metallopeptidase [Defluviimonas sp. D31]